MKKYMFLVLLIAGLMFTACDRFDNNLTKPSEESHEVGDLIVSTFESLDAEDLEPLDALFHEDYLYDGIDKEARIAEITALFEGAENLSFEVKVTSEKHTGSMNAELDWQLLAFDDEEPCYEELFTAEKAIKEDGSWQLLGNLVDSDEDEDTPTQLVIAEYFTFVGCSNCPPVAQKLKDLAQAHSNFIFLEHHTAPPYFVQGNDTYTYYGHPSIPSVVFQGQNLVSGNSDDALASYDVLMDQYTEESAAFEYTIEDLSISDETLSAKVVFSSEDGIDFEDMYLNYVVVANEVSNPFNPAEIFNNVVRGIGRESITANDMNKPIDISVELPANMPSDGKLLIYIQKRPEGFDSNARIYSGEVIDFN